MNKETIDKIQRLGTKYDIKEANGMDTSKEVHEMLETIGKTIDNSDDHIESFIEEQNKFAESMIDFPLSDIPMGRITQLIPVMEQEYKRFKEVCIDYMNGLQDADAIMTQYNRHYAMSEYIATLFRDLGNHETTYLAEFDVMTRELPPAINIALQNDKKSLFEAMNNWFKAYDILLDVIKHVYDTKEMNQFNAVAITIGAKNLYMNCIVREIED